MTMRLPLAAALLVAACAVVAPAQAHRVVIYDDPYWEYAPPPMDVDTPPPPPQAEVPPPPPGETMAWIPGHWKVDKHGAWRWEPGHYAERPGPGASWVPGHWVQRGWGWTWIPGHWI